MNYILESGQDFTNELIKSLCDTEPIEEQCLISLMPLEENHIVLVCGHKFNYSSIYQEILRQKKNFNNLEIQKLKRNQIKCPYCRNIQDGLLPYCKSFIEKTNHVNWPPRYAYSKNKCQAVFRSGKKKGQMCLKPCIQKTCYMHTVQKCRGILKSGKNKGRPCQNQAKVGFFCKKHIKKTTP